MGGEENGQPKLADAGAGSSASFRGCPRGETVAGFVEDQKLV